MKVSKSTEPSAKLGMSWKVWLTFVCLFVLLYLLVPMVSGMILYHPYLPVPSTNYTFVYLDIATLEPGLGFAEIRESMIK